jgi:hypothetical protein
MMGVYAAERAEEVLHRFGVEAIGGQHVLAFEDLDPAHFGHDDDGAAHPAVGAVAATDRLEAIAERHLEANSAAMALACANGLVTRHGLSPVRSFLRRVWGESGLDDSSMDVISACFPPMKLLVPISPLAWGLFIDI